MLPMKSSQPIYRLLILFLAFRAGLASIVLMYCLILLVGHSQKDVVFSTVLTLLWVISSVQSLRHPNEKGLSNLTVLAISDILIACLLSYSGIIPLAMVKSLLISTLLLYSIQMKGQQAYSLAIFTVFCTTILSILIDPVDLQARSHLNPVMVNAFQDNAPMAAIYLIVALSTQMARRQILSNQALADQKERSIEELTKLNRIIVDKINKGIVVCSDRGELKVLNPSAEKLLSKPIRIGQNISSVSYNLSHKLSLWVHEGNIPVIEPFPFELGGPTHKVSFHWLSDQKNDILIEIEDQGTLAEDAQKLKLASLGTLSANIAHEIRNPLSGIKQAHQLLEEEIDTNDDIQTRLLGVIGHNTQRINTLVENIQNISRRKPPQTEQISLKNWLRKWLNNFHSGPDKDLFVTLDIPYNLIIRFDPNHLDQVFTNLVSNALYFAKKGNNQPRVIISGGKHNQDVYVQVSDNGPGLSEDIKHQLFEPFASHRVGGTGLGLYISKDLCEVNRASLTLAPSKSGCTFRITSGA